MNTVKSLTLDNMSLELTHYQDSTECYDEVKIACDNYWGTRPKNESWENYRFDSEADDWSLGPMLARNGFDLGFTVLRVNGEVFSVGGMRRFSPKSALIMCRHFSKFTIKPLTHATLIPFQLEIAKSLGYENALITINQYNNWRKIWYSDQAAHRRNTSTELYELAEKTVQSSTFLGVRMVHGVDQEVLGWKL